MAAPKRTSFEIVRDRTEITQRYLRRQTQAQIAEALSISRDMVAYDLAAIQNQWRQDTTRNLDEDKARELAKIDELERTYWRAWESSLQDKVAISEETVPPTAEQIEQAVASGQATRTPEGTTDLPMFSSKTVTKREGQTGNPAFLGGVQWCIDRRCKLLGLDPASKHEVTGKDGQPLPVAPAVVVYLPENSRGSDGRSG